MEKLFVLLVMIAIITAKVSANVQDDGNLFTEMARFMKENFRDLFQRLDRLESKVNRIVGKESCGSVQGGSDGATQIEDENHAGAGSGTLDFMSGSNETEPEASLKEVDRLQKILSELVALPACQRNAAHVPTPVVLTSINSSQNISCESIGHPISSCLWGHTVNGASQAIVIDQNVVENEGRTFVDGVSFFGNRDDLNAGKCALTIESTTEKDFGLWSCTLISRNSTIFSGVVLLGNGTVIQDQSLDQTLGRTGVKCRDTQAEFLMILKQVYDEGQNCAPCPECDNALKGKLIQAEAKSQRKQRAFEDLTAAFVTQSGQKRRAHVPKSVIFAEVNASATLQCGTDDGHPWNLCLWERKPAGQSSRVIIIVDQEVAQNGGRTSVEGISYVGTGMENKGKCEITIRSTTHSHFGHWSCNLVSRNGTIFMGELYLQDDRNRSIYFVTQGRVVSAYSIQSTQVKKIVDTTENLLGITYDSIREKLYWSNHNGKISRANKDGTVLETVLNTRQYGDFHCLAFDWISGNVYVSTFGGYILAGATTLPAFTCCTVIDGQVDAAGIVLNPVEGVMYWTRYSAGSIHKAGMDGSSPMTLVTGLDHPRGLVLDFTTRRLYWVEQNSKKSQTSDLYGGDLRRVLQLPSLLLGITLSQDRIYWGDRSESRLKSSTKDGQDIQTLYDSVDVRHMIVVPAWNQPTNRTNHCDGQSCSKLCVLSPTSYRCLT